MIPVFRQHMSSLYCAKGFLAYETIVGFGKVLPRLLPAAAIVLTQHLNRSMHADDILFLAKYIIAYELVDWILRSRRQENILLQVPARSNEGLDTRLVVILVLSSVAAELVQAVLLSYSVFGQFLSNAISLTTLWLLAPPQLLFEGLCVLGFSRLIRLAQQSPGQDFLKKILGLPIAAAGLPLRTLYAVPTALDEVIPLDPTILSFSMVFLGFLIGILSVHKRYRKVVSKRRPSSQLTVLENSRSVVRQCERCERYGRLPSEASSDNGSLVEPDLTILDVSMSRARTKSTYLLIASTEENPSNEAFEEVLAPDGTFGRYSQAKDAKSVCATTAANRKKSVRFATFKEQSFREQYALVARRAALKGFQIAHRNHFRQSPDITPQIQPEAYCSHFSSAGSEPGLSLADSDAEDSEEETFAVAPSAAAVVPNHPGDEIGSDEEDEIYGMPIEGQETQTEFEEAVMSIWCKTFGGQQQPDIDPNPSWLYEFEAGLSDSECSEADTRSEEEVSITIARIPSNLHENNNIAPNISNKPSEEEELGLTNFLDLEQEREAVPEPETPDVISTLLLPLTSFRDELEARLQTLDPAQGPEDITFTLTDDEDVELGIRGDLESPPRAWLADGQNRGILEQTHTAEEDEVWFASRTIHRELAI